MGNVRMNQKKYLLNLHLGNATCLPHGNPIGLDRIKKDIHTQTWAKPKKQV
jgi:hypothetical protein